ncbi:hypothetical protein T492DRAFT_1148362 [Pavlovales sp. CCMP2436]|nr:hypothetical protein T492DRAFT_1148362 [Pavlovales sp. CCMP2436]
MLGSACVHSSVLVGDPKSGTTLAVFLASFLLAAWVTHKWAHDAAGRYTLAASNCTVNFEVATKHDFPPCLLRQGTRNIRFDYMHGSAPRRNFPCRGTGFSWPKLPSARAAHRCATSSVTYGQCPSNVNFVVTERDPRDAIISACFRKLKGLAPLKRSNTFQGAALEILSRCVRIGYPKTALVETRAGPNMWVFPHEHSVVDSNGQVLRLAMALGLVDRHAPPSGEGLEIMARAVNATSGMSSVAADVKFVPVTLKAPGERRRTYKDYRLENDTLSWMDAVHGRLVRYKQYLSVAISVGHAAARMDGNPV